MNFVRLVRRRMTYVGSFTNARTLPRFSNVRVLPLVSDHPDGRGFFPVDGAASRLLSLFQTEQEKSDDVTNQKQKR